MNVTAVAELTDTGTDLARVRHLHHILVSVQSLEGCDSLLGLGERLNFARHNQRDLLNLFHAVTAGEHKGRQGRGSKGGRRSMTTLGLARLYEPAAPHPCGREHVTTAGHVTKGGLARAVRTTTADTRNTGEGTTRTPGLSRGLVTSVRSNGVRLTLVLRQVRC